MGQVNEASDVPRGAIAGCGNVHTGGQCGILVDRDAGPGTRSRGGDVEGATARGGMDVASPCGAREHDGEAGAARRLDLVAVGIKPPIVDDEDGARRGVNRDIGGRIQIPADLGVAAYTTSISAGLGYGGG